MCALLKTPFPKLSAALRGSGVSWLGAPAQPALPPSPLLPQHPFPPSTPLPRAASSARPSQRILGQAKRTQQPARSADCSCLSPSRDQPWALGGKRPAPAFPGLRCLSRGAPSAGGADGGGGGVEQHCACGALELRVEPAGMPAPGKGASAQG